MKIGFDMMGTDSAPKVEIETLKLLHKEPIPDTEILCVGKGETEAEISAFGHEFVMADEVVGMHEMPSVVVKQKKNSSIGILCRLLKEGKIDALVSAGNTGAVFAFSMFELGRIEGIDKPALGVTFPSETGFSFMLDVGSNIHLRPINYIQYGILGSIYSEKVLAKTRPRVALLNIGEESVKGHENIQKAYTGLKATNLNFIGNIEGNDIMKGFADVIVCDGFVGNIVIKFAEGMVDVLKKMLKDDVDLAVRRRLGVALVRPALENLKRRMSYEEHGGGILLGLAGVVIISHGRSSPEALRNALRLAHSCVKNGITEEIRRSFAQISGSEAKS